MLSFGLTWVRKPQFTFPCFGIIFFFHLLSKSASAHSESGNSFLVRRLLFARNIIHPKWVQRETEHKLGLKKSK